MKITFFFLMTFRRDEVYVTLLLKTSSIVLLQQKEVSPQGTTMGWLSNPCILSGQTENIHLCEFNHKTIRIPYLLLEKIFHLTDFLIFLVSVYNILMPW